MKKVILAILAVILLLIGLFVFFVMRSFNAENYKEQVIASLKNLTGREVEVLGNVSLTWTPLPTFVMNKLNISNVPESTEKTMVSVNQVQVEIEWMSFFKNPLVIKKIILKEPEILLERKNTQQTNFFFPVLFNPNRVNEQDALLTFSSVSATSVDSLEIISGKIRFKNLLSSEDIIIEDINGLGQVNSLDGPYSFSGSVQIFKQKFNISVQTDKILLASPFQITFSLEDLVSQTLFKTVAVLKFDDKIDDWLSISGSYLSHQPALFFKNLGLKNWYSEGTLSGSYKVLVSPKTKQIQFKDILFSQKLEDKTLLSAKLDVIKNIQGKTFLTLQAEKVDLERFNPQFLSFIAQGPTDVDIQLMKAFWKKIILDPLSLKGTVNQGILSGQLTAGLAQNGAFSLKGNYDLLKKHLTAEVSCSMTDALAWGYDVFDPSYLPQAETKNLNVMGTVDATPEQQALDVQVGTLDKVSFSGRIVHQSDLWQSNLSVQNLNLDSYYTFPEDIFSKIYQSVLPQEKVISTPLQKPIALNLKVTDFTWNKKFFPLIQINGKINSEGVSLSQVELKQSDENLLTVSGNIQQPGTDEISFDNLKFYFQFNEIEKWEFLWKDIGRFFNKYAIEILDTTASYTGNLKEGNLSFSASSQGREISLSGKVQNLLNHPEFLENEVRFVYPNLAQFVRLYWPNTHMFETMPLPIEFKGILSWTQDLISWKQGNLMVGKEQWQTHGKYIPKDSDLSVEILADYMDARLFLDNILRFWQNPQELFQIKINPDFSLDAFVQAKHLKLNENEFKDFKTNMVLAHQKLHLNEFFFKGTESDSYFNLEGDLNLLQEIVFNGKVDIVKMPLLKKVIEKENYSLGQGKVSLKTDLRMQGNSLQSLWNSFTANGNFLWMGAILTGVNLADLKNTTMNILQIAEVPADFNERLNKDFQNGQTPLPFLQGKFEMNQGTLSLSDVQANNDMLEVSGLKLFLSDLGNIFQLEIPFVLKVGQNLPAIIFTLSNQDFFVESANFEGTLTDIIKIQFQKNIEIKQQKLKQEKEQKNIQMQKSAEKILNQTESLLKILQEKVSLNSSEQAELKMAQLTQSVQEIRKLAVKSNLTESEYVSLLGKTKMLAEQAKDFNNWFGVSDFVNRKKMTLEKAEKASHLLNQMEKIYQQNSRSVLMAELVMNARYVNQNVLSDIELLRESKDKTESLQLMNRLDENLLKLQKAYDYMKKQTLPEDK